VAPPRQKQFVEAEYAPPLPETLTELPRVPDATRGR